jgi:hypothetical protein
LARVQRLPATRLLLQLLRRAAATLVQAVIARRNLPSSKPWYQSLIFSDNRISFHIM